MGEGLLQARKEGQHISFGWKVVLIKSHIREGFSGDMAAANY